MATDEHFEKLSDEVNDFLSPGDLRTLWKDEEWSEGTFLEFATAMKQAAQRGLHPFSGHVYPAVYGDSLQLGVKIDGLRALSVRSGEYAGMDGPWWFDDSGQKHEVWLRDDEAPVAAMVEVLRHDHTTSTRGIARWEDYKATHYDKSKGGQVLNRMWDEKGPHMLAKCAEANARRKAFPVIGDIYIPAEVEREHTATTRAPDVEEPSSKEQEATEQLLGGAGKDTASGDGAPQPGDSGYGHEPDGTPSDGMQNEGPEVDKSNEIEYPPPDNEATAEEETGQKRTTGTKKDEEYQKQAKEATKERAEQNGAPEATISEAQARRLWAIAKDDEEGQAYSESALRAMIASEFGYDVMGDEDQRSESIGDIRKEDYEQVIECCRDAGLASRYRAPGTGDMFEESAEDHIPIVSELEEDYDLTDQERACIKEAVLKVRDKLAGFQGLPARVQHGAAMLAAVEQETEPRRVAVERACRELGVAPIPQDFPHRSRLVSASLYCLQQVHEAMRNDALRDINGLGEKRVEEIMQEIGHYDFDVLPVQAPTGEPEQEPNDPAFEEGVEDEAVPI